MTKKKTRTAQPVIPNRVAHSTQPNPQDTMPTRMPERAEFSPKDPTDAFTVLTTVAPVAEGAAPVPPVVVHVPVPTDEPHHVLKVRVSVWRKITDAMNWTKRDE